MPGCEIEITDVASANDWEMIGCVRLQPRHRLNSRAQKRVDGASGYLLFETDILDSCTDQYATVAARHQITLVRVNYTGDWHLRAAHCHHLPVCRDGFDVQTDRSKQTSRPG